jgi:uncharacterized sulfatase
LTSGKENKDRVVYAGRERHSSSRYQNWGYPQRCIRKGDYLYIWNVIPERWPAGAPQGFDPETGKLNPLYDLVEDEKKIGEDVFADIGPTPSKRFLIKNHNNREVSKYFYLACEKRPKFEMYNVATDMDCLNNLAGMSEFKILEEDLKQTLFNELRRTNDTRMSATDFDTFDGYMRYSPMRSFPEPDPKKTLLDLERN